MRIGEPPHEEALLLESRPPHPVVVEHLFTQMWLAAVGLDRQAAVVPVADAEQRSRATVSSGDSLRRSIRDNARRAAGTPLVRGRNASSRDRTSSTVTRPSRTADSSRHTATTCSDRRAQSTTVRNGDVTAMPSTQCGPLGPRRCGGRRRRGDVPDAVRGHQNGDLGDCWSARDTMQPRGGLAAVTASRPASSKADCTRTRDKSSGVTSRPRSRPARRSTAPPASATSTA
jgi:hypothetical protein